MLSDRCTVCLCLSCPVCNVCVLWPYGWTDQDETWHGARPMYRPSHIVQDGDPAPLPKMGAQQSSNFLPMYCGQTAGWIKMPIGLEVYKARPRRLVLDGDQPSSVTKRSTALPTFEIYERGFACVRTIRGPCLLWPSRRPSQLLLTAEHLLETPCRILNFFIFAQ